jgi:hypothetical protein
MRIFKLIIFIIFVLFFISPFIMFVVWLASPEKPLNVLILDKTVLDSKTQEHLSLNWLLTNEKFKHSITGKYEHNVNYFGFFPNDSGQYKIKDFNKANSASLDSIADLYNIAYYTDLYGIYEAEWTGNTLTPHQKLRTILITQWSTALKFTEE